MTADGIFAGLSAQAVADLCTALHISPATLERLLAVRDEQTRALEHAVTPTE